MWRIIKNKSNIWRDQESVESLERYFSVMRNDLPAKFRICEKIPVKIGLNSDEDELWNAHEEGLDEFADLLKKVDGEDVELSEVETPGNSLLDLKLKLAERILESCHFCERRCGVNRVEGEKGVCGVGEDSRVASEFIHHGEEPELVPSYTIFFSGCTFKCQFCQNWDISQSPDNGVVYPPRQISSMVSSRRQRGARNVNWVGGDPTPNLHTVLASLNECEDNIPSVWNSNMYLSEEGMKLLLGTQDVYLTDLKYGNEECALRYSKVPNYWNVVTRNHKIAFKDAELIIRHLVLPEHIECCTREVLKWIETELGANTRVNLMGQYRPVAKARDYPEISRRVSGDEMSRAFKIAEEAGLKNVIG